MIITTVAFLYVGWWMMAICAAVVGYVFSSGGMNDSKRGDGAIFIGRTLSCSFAKSGASNYNDLIEEFEQNA